LCSPIGQASLAADRATVTNVPGSLTIDMAPSYHGFSMFHPKRIPGCSGI
jgi:hypothetical protein